MEEVWPAILLAWIAGFVDALGYLVLSHVFTAHMSGNSASLGAHLGRGDWHEVLVRGLAIPPFIVGIAIGIMAELAAEARPGRARLAPAFGLEVLCLVAFICVDSLYGGSLRAGTPVFFCLVSLLALAMGLQNATLRRAGGARVRTTYISGMLTNMTEQAVRWAVGHWRRSGRQATANASQERPGGRAAIFGLIFLAFIAGGTCGGFGETAWGSLSLLAPIAGLGVLIIQEQVRCRNGTRGKQAPNP